MAMRMKIPTDWDGETWRCWSVEWPDSIMWNAYLRGFLNEPTRGRYWDERTGSVIEAQAIGREIWNRNSPMEESLMACNETTTGILEGILAALQTLANKQCCPTGTNTGSRGSGSTSEPANPYDQAATPEEPPPGFEDMEEFEGHKCNAAQDLINNLKADLIGLSGLSYAGQSPTGLVGALILFFLTPIPFDDLVALAAYLIYSAYSYTFLAEMSAKIGENNDDLLCVLYNSDSSASAKNDFLAELEIIALDYFTTTDDAEWVMGAIEYMLPYDATNILFEDVPTVTQSADCSACNPATVDYGYHNGTETTTHPANPIDSNTETSGTCQAIDIFWDAPIWITAIEYLGTTPGKCGGNPYYNMWNDPEYQETAPDFATDTPPNSNPNGYGPFQRIRILGNISTPVRLTYSTTEP